MAKTKKNRLGNLHSEAREDQYELHGPQPWNVQNWLLGLLHEYDIPCKGFGRDDECPT